MEAIGFEEQNMILNKPDSMTDEECGSLNTFYSGEEFVSCWKPDELELKRLNAGEPIWLIVVGSIHPPVLLTTIKPFVQEVQE